MKIGWALDMKIGWALDMKIGWALDMIGWAYAQPFPTLATPLVSEVVYKYPLIDWHSQPVVKIGYLYQANSPRCYSCIL